MGKGGGQHVFAENWTNYDNTRTCLVFVYSSGVVPGRWAGSGVGKYNAERPKQGRKRFNSIYSTKTIHFSYFRILFIYANNILSDSHVGGWEAHGPQVTVPAVAVVRENPSAHPMAALQHGYLHLSRAGYATICLAWPQRQRNNIIELQWLSKRRKLLWTRCLNGITTMKMAWKKVTLSRRCCRVPSSAFKYGVMKL